MHAWIPKIIFHLPRMHAENHYRMNFHGKSSIIIKKPSFVRVRFMRANAATELWKMTILLEELQKKS